MREEGGGLSAPEIRISVRNTLSAAVEKAPACPLDHSPTRRGARPLVPYGRIVSPSAQVFASLANFRRRSAGGYDVDHPFLVCCFMDHPGESQKHWDAYCYLPVVISL